MRKSFFGVLLILSFGLLLLSGCAKDQVKPDEGMTGAQATAATADLEKQAADKAAAEKAAADRAAAEKAAADKAAAEKAAAQQAAAQQQADAQLQAGAQQQAAAQQQIEDPNRPLKTIYFDFDSYALRQSDRDILYNNADYLLKKYKGKVKIEGHCDERGSDEYNLALGENRAKAALNYLLTLGVPADQLSIISYGKERPADNGNNEEAWAKNRRVEFAIIK